jgi:RND family efflux transporter MFP subunit
MHLATRHLILFLAVILAGVAACGKKEEAKRPEPVVSVTVANVARRDLPLIETAVGAETALGTATGYDPTRVGRTSYIRLPFPEYVAAQLKIGQAVTISNFSQPERTVRGTIREIRPALNATTVSNEVIVTVPSTPNWRPEGSVRGQVTLGVQRSAMVVPEQAVVLRPAGTVVYLVEGNIAKERQIKTGTVRDGVIQVAQGLKGDELIVVDGAGMLSDGAKIGVPGAQNKEADKEKGAKGKGRKEEQP